MSGTTLDPESELIKRETVGLLVEAVFRLSDENQYVFRLFIEGFDESSIAELLGLSEKAVISRLIRSRDFVEGYVRRKTERIDFGRGPVLEEDRMGAL